MQVMSPKVSPSILNAAVGLLQPAFPDLSPTSLVAALKNHGAEIQATVEPLKRSLTIAETAKALHVSLPTIFRMMKEGALPRCRVNKRRVLIPIEAVNKILTAPELTRNGNQEEAA